jgi:hypothetical protein
MEIETILKERAAAKWQAEIDEASQPMVAILFGCESPAEYGDTLNLLKSLVYAWGLERAQQAEIKAFVAKVDGVTPKPAHAPPVDDEDWEDAPTPAPKAKVKR